MKASKEEKRELEKKFIKELEKTSTQINIEFSVTNKCGYQKVPCTKILGKKRALKQWLFFSNYRCYNIYNSSDIKTNFSDYIDYFKKDIFPRIFFSGMNNDFLKL
jgi:hypothetical protein